MVLHSGPVEPLLAGGSEFELGEDCILDRPRAVAVSGHALWPLQHSSNVWAVNGDRLYESCLVYLDDGCAHMCAANCDQSCLSHTLSFWTTCNLYGSRCRLFHRSLWTVICSSYNSALAWEISFFETYVKACLIWSTSSSYLLGSQ
jgi:hypothetical protein